ncbi:hypothetical protein [Sporomusa termitida]|nr:hypothetical protein [Sporomusa termitida]
MAKGILYYSDKEAVILTLVERFTNNYLAIRIPGKTSEAIMDTMNMLYAEYGGCLTRYSRALQI